MKHTALWNWCFYGKHPAARDYFTIGKDAPMAKAYIDWVERGYLPLAGNKENPAVSNSWRFWSRAPSRSQLICGLVRSSCDAIGRTYPLLMLGVGSAEGWEKNWDILPLACEKVWQQLERISTRQYESLDRLKLDMSLLKPPDSRWDELRNSRSKKDGPADGVRGNADRDRDIREKLASLERDRELFMALRPRMPDNLFQLIINWHRHMKSYGTAMPNTLFMGGSMQQTFMAIFLRSLKPEDFTLLWDLHALELTGH